MRVAPRWRAAHGLAVLALAVPGLTACKQEPFRPDAALDGPEAPDAPKPDWWVPAVGEAKNWDIQLNPPFDLSTPRTMYELDLFDVVPSQQTLDYGDGDNVTVPPGTLANAIAMLHGRTPRTYVVCRVGTGSIDLDDPDARKFPGYGPNPPDRMTPPAPGSVIGWNTFDPTNPNERYIDIRSGSRAQVSKLIFKRFDLAKQIGCDAIEADHIDMKDGPGWTIPDADQTSWYEIAATEAHARKLSVGLKNGFSPIGVETITLMASRYDWVMRDRCAEFNDCGKLAPFAAAGKAMFSIDIRSPDSMNNGIDPATACPKYAARMVDGIVKDEARTSAFHACP